MKRIVTCLENIEGGEKVAIETLQAELTQLKQTKFHFKLITYSHRSDMSFAHYFLSSVIFWIKKIQAEPKDVLIVTAPQHFFCLLFCCQKVKTIYFFHGDKSFSYQKIWQRSHQNPFQLLYGFSWAFINNLLLAACLKKVSFIFIPHTGTQEYLIQRFPVLKTKKFLLIPNGIDLKKFHPPTVKEKLRLRKKLHLPQAFILTYIGRIDRLKNIDVVFPVLKSFQKEIFFLIVHPKNTSSLSGKYFHELKTLQTNLGLQKNIRYIEGDFSTIQQWYQCSNCVISLSSIEQSSMVIKEAMSCGVPLLSSDTGDAKTILSTIEKKLIINKPLSENLDKKIRWLLQLDSRQRMILEKNLLKKAEEYSIKITSKKLLSFLNDISIT